MRKIFLEWYKIALIVVAVILLVILIVSLVRKNNLINTSESDTQISTMEQPQGDDSSSEDDGELTYADSLDEASDDEEEGEYIFMMSKDDINAFSMTDSNGILLDFKKEGLEWVCVGYEDIDLDEDRIDNILNYISQIKFVDSFDTENGDDYGLSQESRMFVVTNGGNSSVYISLGDLEEDGSIYFALNYDFTKIYKNSGKLNNVGEYAIEDLIQL